MTEQKLTGLKIFNTISFLLMVTVNVLANLIPINGVKTGEVSDAYRNLFAPAPYTFSIWGLIYLLILGFVLVQLGLFKTKGRKKDDVVKKIGPYFITSSLANMLWIFAWHYDKIGLSLLFMIILFLSLMKIYKNIVSIPLPVREEIFLKLPFRVYFAWITIALIANATVFLVSIGWGGWGIPQEIWTVLVLLVGMLICLSVIIQNKDVAYGIVFVWAYLGVLIKHLSVNGFNGQYSAIIFTAIFCIVVILCVVIFMVVLSRNKRRK